MFENIIDWIKGTGVYIITLLIVMSIIWFASYKISGVAENVKVIEPEPGIKCVIVNRFFNTSIDCIDRN